jgi:hypothetical protein
MKISQFFHPARHIFAGNNLAIHHPKTLHIPVCADFSSLSCENIRNKSVMAHGFIVP